MEGFFFVVLENFRVPQRTRYWSEIHNQRYDWLFGVTRMKAVSAVLENSRVLSSTPTNSALARVAQAAIWLVNYSHRKIPRILNHSKYTSVVQNGYLNFDVNCWKLSSMDTLFIFLHNRLTPRNILAANSLDSHPGLVKSQGWNSDEWVSLGAWSHSIHVSWQLVFRHTNTPHVKSVLTKRKLSMCNGYWEIARASEIDRTVPRNFVLDISLKDNTLGWCDCIISIKRDRIAHFADMSSSLIQEQSDRGQILISKNVFFAASIRSSDIKIRLPSRRARMIVDFTCSAMHWWVSSHDRTTSQ